ncbi:Arm DNA-binding domain-containing protein [Ruegeria lacuscaerulensis]|uniref:Arm DNA-binding domain-containing protein n=1 Tax=Ruegeria lacuscaerulensis TaxID=55218 RepID=UPI001F29C6B6|nr:Arm DNA-binding domain-containing protein [Ruegeria lacuscaerulensis]
MVVSINFAKTHWVSQTFVFYDFSHVGGFRWILSDHTHIPSLSGIFCGILLAALSGKLTKKLVENLGPGRHGDGSGLYLVVDPSGARRWIVRVTVKGHKNRKGAPLRTDFDLGGADVVTLNQARERALEYRRMAKPGLNPRFNAQREIPTFEELSRQVHIDRLPTWKNAKHGQQ